MLERIKQEHIERCISDLGGYAVDNEYLQQTIKFYIRSAVQATDLAVTADERVRLDAKAKAKADNVQRMFHRPGRFGHG
jgi:hypothetical protein